MYDPDLFPARLPSQGTERPQVVFKRSRQPGGASATGEATLWVATADGYRVFSLSGSAAGALNQQQRLGVPDLLEKRPRVPKGFERRRLGDFSVSDESARDLGFQLGPDWNWGRREMDSPD
jgi:hypothetical protein